MTTIAKSRQIRKQSLAKGKSLFKFVLMPMSKEENDIDPFFTPEMLQRIEESRQQVREGKVTVCKTKEDSLAFLASL
jgi:hypothetical protein